MAMLFMDPVMLGQTELKGDIVLMDIDAREAQAATRSKPWLKLNLRTAMGLEGIKENPGYFLGPLSDPDVKVYVLVQFPEGTMDRERLAEEAGGGA